MTDKLERLLDLIAELLHTERPLTADELRHRIPGYPEDKDSFKRAFERDKADLREMSIPLEIRPVPGRVPPEDGYVIDRASYELPDPGLEPDELAAIHLAATAVRLDGTSATAGLRKLGGVVGSDAGASVAVLPAVAGLAEVFEAIGQHRQLRFRYRDKDRVVDPFRLHHERGRWYLQGHDHGADDARSFRLDRVEGAIESGDPGSAEVARDPVTSGPTLDAWALGDDEPIRAVVRVRPPQAVVAARSVGPDVGVTWDDDGSVVLELQVRRVDGFRSFVLGFLDDAEIVDPPELRADLDAWLRQVVEAG